MSKAPRKPRGFARPHKLLTARSGTSTARFAKQVSRLVQGSSNALPTAPSAAYQPQQSFDVGEDDPLSGIFDTPVSLTRAQRKRTTYAARAGAAFHDWISWLPFLEEPYLLTCQDLPQVTHRLPTSCTSTCSLATTQKFCIVSLLGVQTVTVNACPVHFVPSLIRARLFPANTVFVRVAFDFALLRFFRTLQRHSRLGAHGFVKALFDFHANGSVLAPLNVTRKQLQRAAIWFDILERSVYTRAHRTAEPRAATSTEETYGSRATAAHSLPQSSTSSATAEPLQAQIDPPLCLSIADLADRCPACFAGLQLSAPHDLQQPIPLSDTPSVIVCLDGNFTHKRRRRVDAVRHSPCAPTHFLSQQQVEDAAKRFIAAARKDGSATGCSSRVKAAVEGAVKASKGAYDVVGLIGLTCRHGSPLLMCDVRETGEAHFYAFALIEHLILACAGRLGSLGICYDIGCKLATSKRLKNAIANSPQLKVLPLQVKLSFAVALFHVFGHDLDCQLKYSPRRTLGYGLTDGESLERLWSSMADMISVTRNMSLVGRQQALATHLFSLAQTHITRVAAFLKMRQARIVVERLKAAPKIKAAANSAALHGQTHYHTPHLAPSGYPPALAKSSACFAFLSAQRQANAFERNGSLGKRRSKAKVPADSKVLTSLATMLFTALSQLHSLDSWIKRRRNVGSQHTSERLMMAKRTVTAQAKRLLPPLNAAVQTALASPDTPCKSELHTIGDTELFRIETLAQIARYGNFNERAKEPWFSDQALAEGLDAFEMLVRCDEEESRVQRELLNLERWCALKIEVLIDNRDALSFPGWRNFVDSELDYLQSLRVWWSRPAATNREYEKIRMAATEDGFDTDEDSEEEDSSTSGLHSGSLDLAMSAPPTSYSTFPPGTNQSTRTAPTTFTLPDSDAGIDEWEDFDDSNARWEGQEDEAFDISDDEFQKLWEGAALDPLNADAPEGEDIDVDDDCNSDAETD